MKSLSTFINENLISERLITKDDLLRITKEHNIKKSEAVKNASEDLKSYLNIYIDTNDKKMITSVLDAVQADPKLAKFVDIHNNQIRRRLYRGLNLDKEYSDDQILEKEYEQQFVATTDDKKIATGYATGDESSFGNTDKDQLGVVLEYCVLQDTIVLDLSMFEPIITSENYAPEIIIKPKDTAEPKIHRLSFNKETA